MKRKANEFDQKFELKFYLYLMIPIWLVFQIYEELKLKYKVLKSKNKAKSIGKCGYDVIENLLSVNDLDKIRKELEGLRADELLEIPGSKRYKNLHKYSFFQDFSKLGVFQEYANSCINAKRSCVTVMYSITQYEPGQKIFAGHPHFDTFKHQVKFMIAIDDICIDNGPVEIIPESTGFHFKLWKYYFLSFCSLSGLLKNYKPIWNADFYDMYSGEKKMCTLKAGDCLVFNSRLLHKASCINKGFRRVLWIYYS